MSVRSFVRSFVRPQTTPKPLEGSPPNLAQMTRWGQGVSESFQNYITLISFGGILKNVCKILLKVPQIVKLEQNDINTNCREKIQFLNEF